jgi:hypothetical protein
MAIIRFDMAASEIIFIVDEFPEGGFEARALGQSIYTQADSFDALKERVRGAVRCHFEEEHETSDHSAASRPGRGHSRLRLPRALAGTELAARLRRCADPSTPPSYQSPSVCPSIRPTKPPPLVSLATSIRI